MSAWTALFLLAVSVGSMWACYRIGIREERARWARRIDRHLKRRMILQDMEEGRSQEAYELEGLER